MDAQTFIANFGHFANSPDGMKRLREMILHFAISGRLLSDSPSDNWAEDDISEAQALKAAYREKLKLRDTASDQPIIESEQYFTIPSHWQWTRLGNVASYVQRGKGPKYDEKGQTVVVSQKCVQWSGFNLAVARTISDESVADYGDERFLVKGDLLWNSTGTGTAGRIVEFPGSKKRVVTDSHVTVIRLTNFIPSYVRCYIASPVIQQRMEPGVENTLVTGTTNQVELTTSKVAGLPISCPPVEEQQRIVAKVDELMALCDRLESQQQERQKLFPILSQASHDRFTSAPNPVNLNRIFDETGNVSPADLRKTTLNLAVQGQIRTSDKAHWQEYKMRDLVTLITSGSRGWAEFYSDEGPLFLRAQNVRRDGSLLLEDVAHVRLPQKSESSRTRVQKDDLLVVITGAGVSQATWVEKDLGEAYVSQHVALIRLKEPAFAPWLNVHLHAPSGCFGQLQELIYGAKPGLNLGNLRELQLSIPPLAEQRQILAKVDQLMTLIETLEKQQEERDHLAETFAKAVVASLTGTQIAERKEKMKAPKTELISNLQLGTKPTAKEDAPLATLLIKSKGELSAKSLWQQSGLTIDAFYQQLKTELAHGWIASPKPAEMKDLDDPQTDPDALSRVAQRKGVRQLS